MANTFITPGILAKTALGVWQNTAILPNLFDRTVQSEFGGGKGDTVTIRKQASLTASKFDRATGVVIQDVVESKITVKVTDIFDTTVQITQEQWDFDLADFTYEVVEPASKALVRQGERVIAAELAAQTAPLTLSRANLIKSLIAGRKKLNDKEAPLDGRFLLVGGDVAAELLSLDQLLRYDYAGDNGALREAHIGRLLAMPVIESIVVPANEAYICLPEALTFISLVPSLPNGAAKAATSSWENLGIRTVFGYDQHKKQDLISWDCYYECAPKRGNDAFVRMVLGA